MSTTAVLQSGIPDVLTGLIGLASVAVLLLLIAALVGFAYKSMTGGVDWPDEEPEDDETLKRGDSDDEWDYY